MDIGLPANRSKADIRSNIKSFTSCVTFANTVVGPGAGGPVRIDASDKRSPRGRGIPSFVMDVGLPANKSKADVREIIVPVPACVTFVDTMVNRGAVGPVPMERQM